MIPGLFTPPGFRQAAGVVGGPGTWLLTGAVWDDTGQWDDAAFWEDGDTSAPVMTTSATASVAENSPLAITLSATDTSPRVSYAITGGADAAKFEIVGGSSFTTATLRFASNVTKDYETPDDSNTDNVYVVQVTPTDYSGNVGSPLTISVTVTDVSEGAPSYSNPGGTGARSSLITLSTDVTFGGGAVGDLINGIVANGTYFNNSQTGKYITYDFATAKVINEVTWYQELGLGRGVGTWRFAGSNDNVSYTDLGGSVALGGTGGTGVLVQVITTMSGNTTPYRYYKMYMTGGSTTDAWVYEIEFKIST